MLLILLFFLCLVFNIIPILVPPTSLLVGYFYIQTNVNVLLLSLIALCGSLIGRIILYYISQRLGNRYLAENVKSGHEIVRKIVHKNVFITIVCMILYCISPMATTPVFIVAGASRIKLLPLVIGFSIGRFINYAIIAQGVFTAYQSFQEVFARGIFSPAAIILQVGSVVGTIVLLYIDWEELILNKKLKFHKHLFKKS